MKIKRFSARTPIALGVALGAAMAAQTAMADTIVFTEFDVAQGDINNPAAESTGGTDTSATVQAPQPGDQRTISVTLQSGENVAAYVNNGEYHYNQSSNQTFASGQIVWDLSANCRDWTNATTLWIRSGQDHPLSMTVTIDGQSVSRALPDNNNVLGDYSFSISGDDCVNQLTVLVDGTGSESVALDLDIDRIWVETEEPPPPVVPAMSALGLGASLIGLPLFAAGLARRRSRKQ